jgi:glycosyltransferase involved in cell wall biosynthesis
MASPESPASKAPTISLIIATRNRKTELDNFLLHLDRQTYSDFELLVVDQSDEPGIEELLRRHSFRQQYFHSEKRGLAYNRNLALPLAQGEILSFPDDDCWYPPDLLRAVAKWFEGHPDIDMLSVAECNPEGQPMVPKDPPAPGLCSDQPIGLFSERSVWMVQSSMLFMRRKVRDTVGFMNESIGVGTNTKYQSGEETDYFLRAMQAGFKLWFEPSLKVFHPELRELPRIRKINYPYSVGQGYLLRKYHCPLPRLLAVIGRAFAGALVSACRLDFPYVSIYFKRGIGIFVGYFGS